MLKLGTKDVKALYLGERKIRKAYLGEVLVYMKEKPSRLPDGYTEVEYIYAPYSQGEYVINTGVTINTYYCRVVAEVQLDDFNKLGEQIFQAYGGAYFEIYRYSATKFHARANGGVILTTGDLSHQKITMDLDGKAGTAKIGDTTGTFTRANVTTKVPLFLFSTYYTYNNIINSALCPGMRLYSCQVYTTSSQTLKRDFVPCIDPSGDVGLYDLVDRKFYKSTRTGKFTAGPAI